MEVIYPRNTRYDSVSGGAIGDGGIVENSTINQTFYDFLTQYFSEDNSKTIIETVNNNVANLPDVGVNELLFAYMQKFESELKKINESIQNMDMGDKFIENHTVIDKGEFTWNDYTTHIYMLSGGVPSTITINQYINNICGVAIFGSEFGSLDASTGLLPISLYPVEYIETLLANNVILTIGGEQYVPLTICEININDSDLGDQITNDLNTDDNTSEESVENKAGLLYNWWCIEDIRKITSSDDWRVLHTNDYNDLTGLYGGQATTGDKLKSIEVGSWVNPENGNNQSGLNIYGAGERSATVFTGIGGNTYIWKQGQKDVDEGYGYTLSNNSATFSANFTYKVRGRSIWICRDSVQADGTSGEYVGNNGRIYPTIVRAGLEFICGLLQETKWRDGTSIANVTDLAAWNALGTSALCSYDNGEFVETTQGGIIVVDGNENSLITVDGNGLSDGRRTTGINNRQLTSLLLRKI